MRCSVLEMSAIRHLTPLLAAAVILGWMGTVSARAATLDPLKPCYVSVDQSSREPVQVNAGGFAPGSSVAVAIDGENLQSGLAVLPDGTISGSVAAPFQAAGQRPFTLSVTEEGNPANTVAASSLVTALSLRVKPKRAAPRKRVRFIGRGFTSGLPVFGHYVFGGKLRKTVRFGVPAGPCGTFDVKRRQIPVKKPRTGRWTLQADTARAYSKDPETVFVRLAITVKRVFRSP
jgi:hypothetical protein